MQVAGKSPWEEQLGVTEAVAWLSEGPGVGALELRSRAGGTKGRETQGWLLVFWLERGGDVVAFMKGRQEKEGAAGETVSLVRQEYIGQNSEESPKLECPCQGGRDGKGTERRGLGGKDKAGRRTGAARAGEKPAVRTVVQGRRGSGQVGRVDRLALWMQKGGRTDGCGAVGSRLVWA